MAKDIEAIKDALVAAGLEVFRTRGTEIFLAERQRYHIMDSGVRILADAQTVRFTVRSQRSDFPHVEARELFERVRACFREKADARGYRETATATTEVKDPMDQLKVLDVWHEVTYEKAVDDVPTLLDEVRWAMALDKSVAP